MLYSQMRFLLVGALLVALEVPVSAQSVPVPAVIVETVREGQITTADRFPGEAYAAAKVDLVPQVAGVLRVRLIGDASFVEKGTPLFRIDPARFDAAVAQASAQLASAKAAAATAKAAFERTKELVDKNTVAKAKLEQDEAAFKEADAQVHVAAAALSVAKINRSDTEVSAPFAGWLGQWTVAEGALVGPSRGAVVTVIALDPMRVRFFVQQRQLLQAKRKYGDHLKDLTIELVLADGSTYDHTAAVLFEDVEANRATDSVAIIAEVANPDRRLLDGQLVTVKVSDPDAPPELTVSQKAVMLDQSGSSVLTVADGKVALARVETGQRRGGRVAIISGLTAGDQVIVEGILKVHPGMAVTVTESQGTEN